jgi:predicted DNA-binding mobile mystery protein A
MKVKHNKLARKQLDATLKHFESLKTLNPPQKGWGRAIRDAIGMTGEQLAKRLKTNKQRISRIEQDEKLGKVTLNTMKETAAAMDCAFVYGIVPNDSLEQIVRRQAEKTAKKRMARSNQMMRLEKQELNQKEKAEMLKELIEEITETMPKSLWDE